MAFDLHEQEQIDTLKAYWQRWGKWIVGLVLVVLVGYLGFKGYQYYQQDIAQKAAERYQAVVDAGNDLKRLEPATMALQKAYPDSSYATRASLLLAKAAFEAKRLPLAKQQLVWVTKHGKDEALVALARLRLASVYLDQNAFDLALGALNQPHPPAFDALFLDRKGDVFSAKGNQEAARDAYRSAVAKLPESRALRRLVEMKLDALGGG